MSESKMPDWAENLKSSYLSGSSSFFILHGNVDDQLGSLKADQYVLETLSDFLASQILGGYDLVLHYDLGRGLRIHPGGDPARLTRMNATLSRWLDSEPELPRDPFASLRLIDKLISQILVTGADSAPKKVAFLFDYAELVCPNSDNYSEALASFLNWARSPIVKRVNMIFILMTPSLAKLHPTLVQSGFTTEIEIPMPNAVQRQEFIARQFPEFSSSVERFSALSAGLTLSNLDNFLRLLRRYEGKKEKPDSGPAKSEAPRVLAGESASALPVSGGKAQVANAPAKNGSDSSEKFLSQIKKQLIEAQCPGLLEFVEPKLNLSMVAGHTAAKERLTNDARLIQQGQLQAVPMGYLICGPVGVGKSFIAMCYAGTVGIPCVTLKNFRSKYVGETESNLERILTVLRELGPVAVIIDEADAVVGNREASGDSGTSSRVFASLASQMGNTQYRGKIIWFMLTCRPDLLPIDLKRQGRCEEHIPLFYPATPEEIREMFRAMAQKLKISLDETSLPDFKGVASLSGADIEGILTRAQREALLKNVPVDKNILAGALKNFRSSRTMEHELQWLAAIVECTDLRFLPESVRAAVESQGGYDTLASRLAQLKARSDKFQ